jgi:hypothetical protein
LFLSNLFINTNNTGVVIFDAPYALTEELWDIQITTSDIISMAKQIDAVTTKHTTVWFVWHKPRDSTIVHDSLVKRGYKEIQNFYWHKTDHYTPTQVSSYTSAMEMGSVGFLPNRVSVGWNTELSPRERHNFIECPSVSKYTKYENGDIINPCQKPPQLAEWMVKHHAMPGEWILVIGSASGADVIGAANANMNVVCVEKDEKQFKALQKTLLQYSDSVKQQLQDSKEQDAFVKPSVGTSSEMSSILSPIPAASATQTTDITGQECQGCCKPISEDLQEHETCLRCYQPEEIWHRQCMAQVGDEYFCEEHATV